MARLPLIVLAALIAALFSFSAEAGQTLVLRSGLNGYTGAADASLYQDRVDNSDGGNAFLYSGMTQFGSPRRALIKFALTPETALPPGATVTTVTLLLNMDRSHPETTTYTLHRVLADWGEGTNDGGDPGGMGAAANPGDATWRSNFNGASLWSVAGGECVSAPSASALIHPTLGPVTIAGPGLAADLQYWLRSPEKNFGWILVGDETRNFNARRFASRESSAALRPTLTIQWFVLPSAARSDWLLYR